MSSHPPAFSKAFVIPLGVLVALLLVGLQGRGRALPGPGETRAFANVAPLSVQSCIAECQDQFTECTLRCDQDGECVRGCQAEVTKCVRACRGEKGAEPKPDAGAEPPPTP